MILSMTSYSVRLADLERAAKLSFYFHFGLCMYAYEFLGNDAHVSRERDYEFAHRTDQAYSTITFGLLNGGPAGLVWGYMVVFAGMLTVFASVAEMASM